VVTPDGKRAFVSHLVGSSLTRIQLGDTLEATPVPLPAGPSRTPLGAVSGASLGYSLVIDPDRGRLFAPRHALGTVSRESQTGWEGGSAWFGSFAIDVLALADEQAVVPARTAMGGVGYWASFPGMPKASTAASGTIPKSSWAEASSPRDSLFRRKTATLLVASEGTDAVTEHDGWALDPSLVTAVRYPVGKGNDRMHGFAWNAEGAAPQGLALSEDEDTVWVLCRASYDVVAVKLVADPLQANRPKPAPPTALVRFAEDTLDKNGKEGRRVFYNATDTTTSGGLACAGCHPEGRDDGFVWRDARRIDTHDTPGSGAPPSDGHDLTADDFVFVGHPAALFRPENGGYPRQTPMLAGRIASPGPYGWHAQSKTLDARLAEGFRLHRWEPPTGAAADGASARILYLKAFLRVGLVPPPIDGAPLTERESLGKRIFESPETQCVTCHPPATEFTTRAAVPLRRPLPTRATFAKEADPLFKVPGLAFVGGTPPYYHDGSAPTLTALVEENGDRMGKTSHLSADERAALVAYLERL
jgi:mono/diheme cytochrome c family protein